MRRVLVISGVVALVSASFAVAAVINGTARNDVLRGTAKADRIDGRGGNDRMVEKTLEVYRELLTSPAAA